MTKKQVLQKIVYLVENGMPIQTKLLHDIVFLLKSDFESDSSINNAISKIGTYCFPFTSILEKMKEIIILNCSKGNKTEVLWSLKKFYSNSILEMVSINVNGVTPDFAMLLGLTEINILNSTNFATLKKLKILTEYIIKEAR